MPVGRAVVDQLCLHQWEGATVWAVSSSVAQLGEIVKLWFWTSPVANSAPSLHPPFFCLNIQAHKRPQFKPQLCVYLENTSLTLPRDPRLQSPTGRCRCVREDPPSYIILNADCCLLIAQFSCYFFFFFLIYMITNIVLRTADPASIMLTFTKYFLSKKTKL